MQTQITVADGAIIIAGPYSPDNNQDYRECGGKFRDGAWRLPDNPSSRGTVAALFGERSDEVEVLVPAALVSDGPVVQFRGYVLASRGGRDWRVRMPDGVSLEAGGFSGFGGSVKHPRVALSDDVVFRLRCRKAFADYHNLAPAPVVEPSSIEI